METEMFNKNSSLIVFLSNKFTKQEMESVMNARETFKSPASLDEAIYMSCLTDHFYEAVFLFLKEKYHFDTKKMNRSELLHTQLLIPIWEENFETWVEPIFYTNFSVMIHLGTDFSGEDIVAPSSYHEMKKTTYKKLSRLFLYRKNRKEVRIGCPENLYPSN